MAEIFGFDAYSPKEIAERVETTGVVKARLPILTLAVLGRLAGGFIGLGALYFTLMTSDPSMGFADSRLVGGVTFSLGLILVVLAGAELFTGNNLLIMAWASRRITTGELARNWTIVYQANFANAIILWVAEFWWLWSISLFTGARACVPTPNRHTKAAHPRAAKQDLKIDA